MRTPTEHISDFLQRFRSPLIGMLATLLISAGCKKEEPPGDHAAQEKGEKHAPGEDKHEGEVKLTEAAIKKYGIVVEAAKKMVLSPTLIAPARLAYNAEAVAHVGAVLKGRAVDLKVKKGDSVLKGEALIVVESPELGEAQSDYLQKKTAAGMAGPSVEIAKSTYDRAKSLYEGSKGISLTELQKREADYKVAQGTNQAAQSSVTAAENKLHLFGMDQAAVEELTRTKEIQPRYTITSPIEGQVIEREVTLGELVSPDKEALLVIADMRTLWVLADVPEARIKEIAIGAKARVTVAAIGQGVFDGKVSFIDPALDANTRTARVRMEIQDGKSGIRPGMFGQAEIVATLSGENGETVLAIPEEAVQTVEGRPVVFTPVKAEINTFMKHPVTVGKSVSGMVAVLSGLKDGDELVVAGSFILKAELGKSAAGEE